MTKLAFLPIIIITVAAMFTWAMAQHMKMANEHRAIAALRPRGRPYATSLPKSLSNR